LLRQDYRNRSSGRDLLVNQAQLLGISPETIEANVQNLYSIGIDYNNALLGTKPQTKRQKIAWMLKELFDYQSPHKPHKVVVRYSTDETARVAIHSLYDFIRYGPKILIKSINSMEETKDKLRERVVKYRR